MGTLAVISADAMLASRRLPHATRRLLTRTLSVRSESDAFGPIDVASDVLWGAQTQRSLQNFPIGGPAAVMPGPVVTAFGVVSCWVSQPPALTFYSHLSADSYFAAQKVCGALQCRHG